MATFGGKGDGEEEELKNSWTRTLKILHSFNELLLIVTRKEEKKKVD